MSTKTVYASINMRFKFDFLSSCVKHRRVHRDCRSALQQPFSISVCTLLTEELLKAFNGLTFDTPEAGFMDSLE